MKSIKPQYVTVGLSVIIAISGWSAWLTARNVPEPTPSKLEHTVMSVVWYQTAAEFKAHCYQAYNLGKLMLDNDLALIQRSKKRAIIVDVDETVLDNSPHSALLIKEEKTFPYQWNEWVGAAKAEALPGAVEFLNYASSKGVDVFYISNRTVEQVAPTMENLKKAGFPQAQADHLLFRTNESGKEKRRLTVAEDHDIVLLFGDNLNDFSYVFEKKSIVDRSGEVTRLKNEFGKQFIVLPNPIYGDWEGAVYNYNYRLSDEEKDALRKSALRLP